MSLIETPFGFSSTAAEVAAGVDLAGRSAIVTGASSGIGFETARALARIGAEITLAVRDIAAGERAAEAIAASTGSLGSVARYALDRMNAERLRDVSEKLLAAATGSLRP